MSLDLQDRALIHVTPNLERDELSLQAVCAGAVYAMSQADDLPELEQLRSANAEQHSKSTAVSEQA